jgi:hypothetical protein
VDPVGTEAARDDNDATEPEQKHQPDALDDRKLELKECRHRQYVYHEIGDHIDDSLDHEWRAFRDTFALGRTKIQLPVFANWTICLSVGVVCGEKGLMTHMHWSHKAMRKVRKAAMTIPNVTHTSFRKSDLAGAIRK